MAISEEERGKNVGEREIPNSPLPRSSLLKGSWEIESFSPPP